MRDTTQVEYELIGTILSKGSKALHEVSGILKPVYFADYEMSEAYRAVVDMDLSGMEITPGALIGYLSGKLTGDMKVAIINAVEAVISPSAIKQYARIIVDSWKMREASKVAAVFGLDEYEDVSKYIAMYADMLHAVAGHGDEDSIKTWAQVVEDAKKKMFQPISERRLYLGLPGCDMILGGIDPTDYMIIAARPAVGKSAFGAQIVRAFVKRGKKTLLVSLEMPGQQLAERMTTSVVDIDMDTIRSRVASRGAEADIEREQIETAADLMQNWNIDVHDTGRMTPAQLQRLIKIRRYDVVVIDHIGLMLSDVKTNNREQEVSTISRALRAIAMNCNIQIIALCQLNRAVEDRASKRIMLRDLRDSGSLEQDATQVVGLSPIGNEPDDNRILFEALKNRNGRLGTQVLNFDKPHMTFYELEERYVETERKKMRGMEI